MDRKRAAVDADLIEEDDDEVPSPELDLKRAEVEVLHEMPGLVIHICGRIFASKLKEASRVDCTCMSDPDYVDNDDCNGMLKNFAWLADQIHAKRSLDGRKEHVYVNCAVGQVRSVLTVGIYLIKYGGLNLEDAAKILRLSRGGRWYESSSGRKALTWLAAYSRNKATIQSVKPAEYKARGK